MKNITYVKALNQAIAEEMERDENVFLIGEDVGVFGGTFGVARGLLDKFGKERIISTPISEAAIAGAATGAAMTGLRPIAEIMFIDFITIALDQIINQAAKARYMFGGNIQVPMVLRTQGGGGRAWAAQHSQSLEALVAHIPGLKVVMPSTPMDAKGLLKSAIRDNDPVVFIEHKQLYNTKGDIPEEDYMIPIGKAAIKRKGADITVIASSYMVLTAMQAAQKLSDMGIDIEVMDIRTLVPLDKNTIIESIKKTGRVLIVQEACKRGSFGAEIMRVIMEEAFNYLKQPAYLLAGLNVPIPFSYVLEEQCYPTIDSLTAKVKEMVNH